MTNAGGRTLAASFLLSLLCAQFGTRTAAQEPGQGAPSVKQIFAQSLEAIEEVNDYQGEFVKRERIEDELKTEMMFFKFARPFKVYLKYIDPNPGQEVLYVRGNNDNRIKAHKGSFPDITVNLSPYGRQAMKDSHQPIMTFGIERQIRIMADIHHKATKDGQGSYKVSDGGVFAGEPVWKVEARLPSTGRTVRANDDENLWQLAKRVGQDMYVILHHNEEIDSPKDIDEGDEVYVPDHYASRLEYLIGKKTHMPLKETSWDHEGHIYEQYEYQKLQLSPGLTDDDFDPENEEYDF